MPVFIVCKIKRCVRKIYFLPFEGCLRSCTETSIRQWPPIFKLHKKAAFLLSTKDDHSCLKKKNINKQYIERHAHPFSDCVNTKDSCIYIHICRRVNIYANMLRKITEHFVPMCSSFKVKLRIVTQLFNSR